MFNKISMTGTGGSIVILMEVILPLLGFTFDKSEIEGLVAAFLTVLGAVWFIIGQLRRQDLIMGMIRNK